jgi:hypothetical protein
MKRVFLCTLAAIFMSQISAQITTSTGVTSDPNVEKKSTIVVKEQESDQKTDAEVIITTISNEGIALPVFESIIKNINTIIANLKKGEAKDGDKAKLQKLVLKYEGMLISEFKENKTLTLIQQKSIRNQVTIIQQYK